MAYCPAPGTQADQMQIKLGLWHSLISDPQIPHYLSFFQLIGGKTHGGYDFPSF